VVRGAWLSPEPPSTQLLVIGLFHWRQQHRHRSILSLGLWTCHSPLGALTMGITTAHLGIPLLASPVYNLHLLLILLLPHLGLVVLRFSLSLDIFSRLTDSDIPPPPCPLGFGDVQISHQHICEPRSSDRFQSGWVSFIYPSRLVFCSLVAG